MSAERALSQIFHTYILPVLCAELGSAQVCTTLLTPWTAARQAPLPMGILQARVMEWVAPGVLPNPGIKPRSPALKANSLSSEPPGSTRILEWAA